MALIGYARVSLVGQSLEVQLDKLKNCRKIFQEQKSASVLFVKLPLLSYVY